MGSSKTLIPWFISDSENAYIEKLNAGLSSKSTDNLLNPGNSKTLKFRFLQISIRCMNI